MLNQCEVGLAVVRPGVLPSLLSFRAVVFVVCVCLVVSLVPLVGPGLESVFVRLCFGLQKTLVIGSSSFALFKSAPGLGFVLTSRGSAVLYWRRRLSAHYWRGYHRMSSIRAHEIPHDIPRQVLIPEDM